MTQPTPHRLGVRASVARVVGGLAVFLLTGGAGAQTYSLEVEALIDGRDHLVIQGDVLYWHHYDFAAVGRFGGGDAPTVLASGPVTLAEWLPQWSAPPPDEIRFEEQSAAFQIAGRALPENGRRLGLVPLIGRGEITLAQQPSADNGYTAIVEFDDDPFGGPRYYAARLTEGVPVDVKPRKCPNKLSLKRTGRFEVAILGLPELDVGLIDPDSVRLAGVAASGHAVADVAGTFEPFLGKGSRRDCGRSGPDGYPDLTLRFRYRDLYPVLSAHKAGAVTLLPLTGSLRGSGEPIDGEDVIVVR